MKTGICHRIYPLCLFSLGVILAGGMGLSHAETDHRIMANTLQEAFIQVAREVGPSVVSIHTEQTETVMYAYPYGRDQAEISPFGGSPEDFLRRFFGELPSEKIERRSRGLGSGFVIRSDGYILTNDHVVAEADKIQITLSDGREFTGEVVGSDARFDVAIVRINASDLKAAALGDSDEVRIGQWAIAIGNPFGHIVNNPEPTVTAGIVSALHRSLPLTRSSDRVYTGLIQTDASINQGNSGGPLVDINGKVIGMNTAILSPTGGNIGVGFALPINFVKEIMGDLIEGKEVRYGWLGVMVQDIDKDLAEYFGLKEVRGAMIASVVEGGPAAQAGVRAGDVVLSVDGKPLTNMQELLSSVARAKAGSRLNLGIVREGKAREIGVQIGERPSSVAGRVDRDKPGGLVVWRGLQVASLPAESLESPFLLLARGVLVAAVEPASAGEKAGIRRGDLIMSINYRPIAGVEDFQRITRELSGKVLVQTQRGYAVIPD